MTSSSGGDAKGTSTSGFRVVGSEGALVASALVGGAALCRMMAGGWGGAVSVPILTTAAAGCVVPGILLRRQARAPLAAATGAVTVALVALWTSVPRATRVGLPTATTFRVLRADLRGARGDLSSFQLPLHASPGIVVLGTLLAGMAAVAARLIFGNPATRARRFPAAAVIPSTALVTWSCVAEPSTGSAILVAALIATSSATVALAAPAVVVAAPTGSSGRAPGRRPWLGAGVVVSVLAMAVAVVAGVTTADQSGASTGSGGSATAGTIPPTGLALASDLLGLERRDPSVVLFWARSPVPTYWQVGVLTQWQDGRWLADQSTRAELAGGGEPAGTAGVLPARGLAAQGLPAPSNHTFAVTVTVGDLSSRLLPVPPTTVTVEVPGGGSVTASGALASSPSRLDERYTATAIVPPAVTAAPLSTTTGLSASQLQPYLALPPISPVVSTLARQVTAIATTPLSQAEALVDWFRSGMFRYTLTPPALSPGTDALVGFLTDTRAGTCEAFAGAFAVMARSLGLPTRVAVGFTGGRSSPRGTMTVRGADAHEWPEVYLGPALGWVSFEPTPQLPSGELSPSSVVGPTGIQLPTTIPPTRSSVPLTVPTTPPATAPPNSGTSPNGIRGTSRVSGTTAASAGAGVWVLVVGGVLIALATAFLVMRRRRGLRLRSAPHAQRVLWSYQRAERALRKAGMARPTWRSPPAHVRALVVQAQQVQGAWARDPGSLAAGDELLAALRDLLVLAQLLEGASYRGRSPTPDDVVQADAAARRVRRTLRRRSVRDLAEQVAMGRVDPASALRI